MEMAKSRKKTNKNGADFSRAHNPRRKARSIFRNELAACVLGCFFGLLACSSTLAQQLPDNLYSTYRVSLTPDELDLLINTVIGGEDTAEAELAHSLYQSYTRAWKAAADLAREDLRSIREQGRGRDVDFHRTQIQPKIKARQSQWADEARSLESRFFDDVRALLTAEQLDRWPEFERDRRRMRLLKPFSRIAGEGVDLIALIDELNPPQAVREQLASTLEDYANEFDVALKARQEAHNRIQPRLDAIVTGESAEDGSSWFRQLMQYRIALRDLNEKYAGILKAQMPDDFARRFEEKFDRVRYPRIFSATQVDRYLDEIHHLEDLTEQQNSQIERMVGDFKTQIQPIVDEMIRMQRERDAEVPIQYRIAKMRQENTGQSDADLEIAAADMSAESSDRIRKERELWEKRRALEKKLVEDIFATLTPKQQAEAPITDKFPQPGGRPTGSLESGSGDDK